MKELTIEEKAKRYDRAIEKLRNLHEDYDTVSTLIDIKEELEQIFPELKESEDERIIHWIRKELEAKYVVDNIVNNVIADKALAWLEKQGKQNPEVKYVYTKFRIGDVIVEIKPNGDCCPVRVKYVGDSFYMCESDDRKVFLSFPIINQDDYKLVEQKPADKVEPKFKVGDWIVNNNGELKLSQVIELSWPDSKIKGAEDNLESFINTTTLDKQYHLWTIQDAKDGDIIQLSGITAIFKSCIYDSSCKCHCTVYKEKFKTYEEDENYETYGIYNAKPATKEQRDLLFKKMHEAGYEWDAEKKELTKIERNPVSDTLENSHNMTKEKFLHDINAGRYPKYILSQIKEGKPEKDCSSIVCTSSNNILLAKYENGKWYQAHFKSATFGYPSQSIYYTSISEDVIYWTDGLAEDRKREQFDNDNE